MMRLTRINRLLVIDHKKKYSLPADMSLMMFTFFSRPTVEGFFVVLALFPKK